MPSDAPAAKKIPWAKLAVAALAIGAVLAVAAALLLRGSSLHEVLDRGRALADQGMAMIRRASPWAFFTGMAVLPAVGAPMLAFILAAGPLWTDKLGMGAVILFSLLAVTVNFTLTYALARWALRPLLTKLVTRLGYRMPSAEEGDATDLIVIMRVTQGIPYFVQNYLLGLAEVPFGKYFLWTVVLSVPQNIAALLFGDAIMHGKGKMVVMGAGLLVALVAATHLVRRHYAQRKPKPAA